MYHVYIIMTMYVCMYVCMPVCRKANCGNIAVCNPLKINHVYRKKNQPILVIDRAASVTDSGSTLNQQIMYTVLWKKI